MALYSLVMTKQKEPTSTPKLSWELDDLSRQVGEFIRCWGFKSIHGRIWALLYLSSEPLDATRLTQHLKASKTLISFSIKELLEYDVIREVGQGPRGTILLSANPEIEEVIKNVLRTREKVMLSKIAASSKKFAAKAKSEKTVSIDPDKLNSLGEMVQSANDMLKLALDTSDDTFGSIVGLAQAFTLFTETVDTSN